MPGGGGRVGNTVVGVSRSGFPGPNLATGHLCVLVLVIFSLDPFQGAIALYVTDAGLRPLFRSPALALPSVVMGYPPVACLL